jgi:hypothetical protein
MNSLAPWLLPAGICLAALSAIWFVAVAFRRHVAWGLAVLFVPFANLIFLCYKWRIAKRPFFCGCLGCILCVAGVLMNPDPTWRALVADRFSQLQAALHSADGAKPAESGQAGAAAANAQPGNVDELRLREQVLRARKASLDLRNPEAVTALAQEITAYNTELRARAAAAPPLASIAVEKPAPPMPPPSLWVEDVTKAQIPSTPAAGSFAGEPFTTERATIEDGILSLRHHAGRSGEQEFALLLFLNGRSPAGRNFHVIPESRVGSLHVHMKQGANNQKSPQTQIFMNGYALRLEFGARAGNEIPGRIYLCMPDAAKSYVAGVFRARLLDQGDGGSVSQR